MPVDYHGLTQKLLNKSRAGKVGWQETADEATFIAILEGRFAFEISNKRGRYLFAMKNQNETEIFTLTGEEPSGITTIENDRNYPMLQELYELARRTALGIDQAVSDAENLLDSL
ncbi:MAG TPA: hypothetical protein VGK24_03920 [Candidatus Angelobacter sp.]|jgi:hypothetical protein